MDQPANPLSSEAIAAAFDWWRDAGIDCDLGDEPTDWLAATGAPPAVEPEPRDYGRLDRTASVSQSPILAPSIDRSTIPEDLAAFQAWWLNAGILDDGRSGARISPRGMVGADLMIIVPQPEADDSETLLSGPSGRLLAGFLRAIGSDQSRIYLGSVLPRHTPHADWSAVADMGYDIVLRHHVGLVRPKRLILFGGNILPLLDNTLPNYPDTSFEFNHEGVNIPVLAARGLDSLLERQAWKAGFWQDWLRWSG